MRNQVKNDMIPEIISHCSLLTDTIFTPRTLSINTRILTFIYTRY